MTPPARAHPPRGPAVPGRRPGPTAASGTESPPDPRKRASRCRRARPRPRRTPTDRARHCATSQTLPPPGRKAQQTLDARVDDLPEAAVRDRSPARAPGRRGTRCHGCPAKGRSRRGVAICGRPAYSGFLGPTAKTAVAGSPVAALLSLGDAAVRGRLLQLGPATRWQAVSTARSAGRRLLSWSIRLAGAGSRPPETSTARTFVPSWSITRSCRAQGLSAPGKEL